MRYIANLRGKGEHGGYVVLIQTGLMLLSFTHVT